MSARARMGRLALVWLAALALPVHAGSAAGAFTCRHHQGAPLAHRMAANPVSHAELTATPPAVASPCPHGQPASGAELPASHHSGGAQASASADLSASPDADASECSGSCASRCAFAATAMAPDHPPSVAMIPAAVRAVPAPFGFASVIARTLERPPRSTAV